MRVEITSIPQEQQRYRTLGDYWRAADGDIFIRVQKFDDWRYEFLIALHELVEEAITRQRGIAEPEIKAFDEAHLDSESPGDLGNAPYHREHIFAEAIERLIADRLGVKWDDYATACEEAMKA